MEINSVSARISGVAGLSDNSTATFLGLYDSYSKQIHLSVDANVEFRKNYPSQKTKIESLAPYTIAAFPTTGRIIPASDPTDTGLVVDSLSMVITGRVSFDNNTHDDFSFEIRDDGSIYDHTGDKGREIWKTAFGDTPAVNTIGAAVLTALYSTEADPIAVTIAS